MLKEDPQRLIVIGPPFPVKRYQMAGALLLIAHPNGMASVEAPEVVPVTVWPHAIVMAPEQVSLGGGLVHVTFKVKLPLALPKPVM